MTSQERCKCISIVRKFSDPDIDPALLGEYALAIRFCANHNRAADFFLADYAERFLSLNPALPLWMLGDPLVALGVFIQIKGIASKSGSFKAQRTTA